MGVFLRRPSAAQIEAAKAGQRGRGVSYPGGLVGVTAWGDASSVASSVGAGWEVDFNRVELGVGEAVFEAACAALRRWAMFDLGWVEAWTPEVPLREGEVVGIVARVLGIWALSFAEIRYVVDEERAGVRWFGFGYGTLPDHVECGEERFRVGWDRASGQVVYELLAFSRPQHPLARLVKPYVRRQQRRFAEDSKAAMRRAVQ